MNCLYVRYNIDIIFNKYVVIFRVRMVIKWIVVKEIGILRN